MHGRPKYILNSKPAVIARTDIDSTVDYSIHRSITPDGAQKLIPVSNAVVHVFISREQAKRPQLKIVIGSHDAWGAVIYQTTCRDVTFLPIVKLLP